MAYLPIKLEVFMANMMSVLIHTTAITCFIADMAPNSIATQISLKISFESFSASQYELQLYRANGNSCNSCNSCNTLLHKALEQLPKNSYFEQGSNRKGTGAMPLCFSKEIYELCVQQTGLTSSNASKRGCLSINLQGLMPYGTRARG